MSGTTALTRTARETTTSMQTWTASRRRRSAVRITTTRAPRPTLVRPMSGTTASMPTVPKMTTSMRTETAIHPMSTGVRTATTRRRVFTRAWTRSPVMASTKTVTGTMPPGLESVLVYETGGVDLSHLQVESRDWGLHHVARLRANEQTVTPLKGAHRPILWSTL